MDNTPGRHIMDSTQRKLTMTEAVMSAYLEGLDEETIMRIFDLTHTELTYIILSY